jgi:hypothetical protein
MRNILTIFIILRISNVAKIIFDVCSPAYNQRYRYEGKNAGEYPFDLKKNDFYGIEKSLNESRKYIGNSFNGSFKGVDASGGRGFYRSVDYIDFLTLVTNILIVPLLKSTDCKEALQALVRAITILMQKEITESQLCESER